VFLQDWKKFQFSFLGANSFTEIHNGPDARIKGVELDASWRPVRGLFLSGSAAYTDAKTKRNLCGADDPTYTCSGANFVSAPAGTRLPVTPRFKGSVQARYEFPIMDDAKAHLQTVVSHQSSASSDIRTLIFDPLGNPHNPAAETGRLPAYTLTDFAVGIDWKKWMAELFVENAFDERAQLTRYQECGQCFQRPYIVVARPRTIGVRVSAKF
jgi:iron complex outermembrane receptor protein